MEKTKRVGDMVLPGKGWHWILGVPVSFFLLFMLGTLVYAPQNDLPVRGQPGFEEAVKRAQQEQQMNVQKTTLDTDRSVTPDKMQSSVRAMADFMVKDGNIIGLRMWARSLGVSTPEFASATTLREEIRRASNDFALYQNNDELLKLTKLLDSSSATLNEVSR